MTLQKDNHKEIALIANLMNPIGVLRAQCDKQSVMLKVAKEALSEVGIWSKGGNVIELNMNVIPKIKQALATIEEMEVKNETIT